MISPYKRTEKLPNEPESKICSCCREVKPITEYHWTYRHTQSKGVVWFRRAKCTKCMAKVSYNWRMRMQGREEAMVKLTISNKAKTCTTCKKYPCFEGIDNMRTNLAPTCKKYEYIYEPK